LTKEFADGVVASGVATAGGTTWLRGIQVDRGESEYLLRDFGGFIRLSREQTLVGAFRALIDYIHDLLAAIVAQSPDRIPLGLREKAKLRRVKASEFCGKLRTIDLALSRPDETMFNLLRVTRNLLEHNNSLIDAEYIKLAGAGVIGDQLEIDGEKVREALTFVRAIAVELEASARRLQLVND